MDFISNQKPQIAEMLKEMGLQSIDELFQDVPRHLKLAPPSQDDGLSEYEGLRLMENLASRNTFSSLDSYLGGGAYEHHVPAIISAVCSKSEFLTAYTPYQAEASQGMLQAIFEFQSAICAITGLDVANASVYDGASACAEAVLMALRQQKGREEVILASSLHPSYQDVVELYLTHQQAQVKKAPFLKSGEIDLDWLAAHVSDKTAAILIQSPNFFGVIEQVKEIVHLAKDRGALAILSANPLSYGLFASAGELGVDIAVGDCQPLGIPLQFGGPYAGYMACREALMRQMPGRIVGETLDAKGKRGFVLTLQAREQHIRREKATSNICTNQALAALASLLAMLWYGPKGLKELALTNYQRASYLKHQLSAFCEVEKATTFNEFVVYFKQPMDQVFRHFRSQHIEPGLDIKRFFPECREGLLVAVTETKSLAQLERYVQVAKSLSLNS